MLLYIAALIVGLVLLVLSADWFVDGAAGLARRFGMSPLLIGMVIVGFGTSAPEMLVSALSAYAGNPGIALGNAYGSNITNIALILGLTAVICPIVVSRNVLRVQVPLLLGITVFSLALLWDGYLSRIDGILLLILFTGIMALTIKRGLQSKEVLDAPFEAEIPPTSRAVAKLVFGLAVLIGSSRLLVWGAVSIAQILGVSDLLIGLTIVALGTSLPELASSIIAARRGENDIALGNVLGSNLFNTLAVVGIASTIHPLDVEHAVIVRDMPVMAGLTLYILIAGLARRGKGVITRTEGFIFLGCYVVYTGYLVCTAL